jgi:isopentenyl phosphate kinase
MAELTILKLGGSVITVKEKPMTPNTEAITRLANEIGKANITPLIIVHGGGSFGHYLATKYHLERGYYRPEQIFGLSETHYAMLVLNRLVLGELIKQEIPVVSIQTSACFYLENGRISSIRIDQIAGFLKLGLTPLLYGDVVLDSKRGFAILSGDQIVSRLAIDFKAKRMIIGVNVDGLYTSDPFENPDAELIREITTGELRKGKWEIGPAKTKDVTGGMMGKIRELIPAVEKGTIAIIVNAAKPGRIYKALKGEPVIGTVIRR